MSKYGLVCQAGYIPHHDEDAHFICARQRVIGVADGIGGFRDEGINSGLFANKLMRESVKAVTSGVRDPLSILKVAYSKTPLLGGSTACIISLDKTGVIDAANLGDSGFVVIRKGDIILKSRIQQRYHNAPYCLGREKDGSTAHQPEEADRYSLKANKKDRILLFTDGLSGNMNHEAILRFMHGKERRGLAKRLAHQALEMGLKADDITIILADVV